MKGERFSKVFQGLPRTDKSLTMWTERELETERERQREKEIETDRHRQRQIERVRERGRYMERDLEEMSNINLY